MQFFNETKNEINLNTPKSINLESLSIGLPKSYVHKIIFLVHQINYRTITNGVSRYGREPMRKLLGLNPNDYHKILKILVDNLIITKCEESTYDTATDTGTSAGYKFINPFDWKDEANVDTHTYNIGGKCPLFIKKWVANKFEISNTSVKIPTQKKLKPENKYTKLELENQRLKAELARLEGLLSISNRPIDPEEKVAKSITEGPDVSSNIGSDINSIHTFKNGEETYVVNCWGELVSNSEFNLEEIEEELADAKSYEKFELSGKEIIKRYDINEHIYTVSIFKSPGLAVPR